MRTEKGKQAFQSTDMKVWNELPDHIKTAPSTDFLRKKELKRMILEEQHFTRLV